MVEGILSFWIDVRKNSMIIAWSYFESSYIPTSFVRETIRVLLVWQKT